MPTPYMNLTLPTPGPSGTPGPGYATLLNQAVSNGGGDIDSHNHTAGNGNFIRIPESVVVDGNLPMAGYSISGLASLILNPGTVGVTYNMLSLDANGNRMG